MEIHTQSHNVSEAVRKLTGSSNETSWGTGWDVLWLGHCGENAQTEDDLVVSYPDFSLPETIKSWEGRLNNPGRTRYVQWSYQPICTFGYAVTGAGAQKLLEVAANDTTGDPFDNWLTTQCRLPEVDIKCISVNPELFHDHKRAGKQTSLNNVVEEGDSPEEAEQSKTENILHSARCNAELQQEMAQWEAWEKEGWVRNCETDDWPEVVEEEPPLPSSPPSPWWGSAWGSSAHNRRP